MGILFPIERMLEDQPFSFLQFLVGSVGKVL
jgi:hypothetical protein